jgi:hypothetical protein
MAVMRSLRTYSTTTSLPSDDRVPGRHRIPPSVDARSSMTAKVPRQTRLNAARRSRSHPLNGPLPDMRSVPWTCERLFRANSSAQAVSKRLQRPTSAIHPAMTVRRVPAWVPASSRYAIRFMRIESPKVCTMESSFTLLRVVGGAES